MTAVYPPPVFAWHLFRSAWLSPPRLEAVSEEEWDSWIEEVRAKCDSRLPRRFRKERERRRLLSDLHEYYRQCLSPTSPVCVRPASNPQMGLGLFARVGLRARGGAAIGAGRRRRISQKQRAALEERENSFACDPETGIVHIVDGPASLANHACGSGANASLELEGPAENLSVHLKLKPSQLAAGAEIFIDYGQDYWSDRKEACICSSCTK
jgi:hypothetical protein